MQKIIDKAIGVIQHELIRSIDEFYEGDELTQNKISKAWNLILHELNDHSPLGDWYKEAKRRKVIEDEYRETMVAIRKAENMKLGEMETWLDDRASKVNRNTKEYEYIFSLYNKINDIRTFYAQHLFRESKDV